MGKLLHKFDELSYTGLYRRAYNIGLHEEIPRNLYLGRLEYYKKYGRWPGVSRVPVKDIAYWDAMPSGSPFPVTFDEIAYNPNPSYQYKHIPLSSYDPSSPSWNMPDLGKRVTAYDYSVADYNRGASDFNRRIMLEEQLSGKGLRDRPLVDSTPPMYKEPRYLTTKTPYSPYTHKNPNFWARGEYHDSYMKQAHMWRYNEGWDDFSLSIKEYSIKQRIFDWHKKNATAFGLDPEPVMQGVPEYMLEQASYVPQPMSDPHGDPYRFLRSKADSMMKDVKSGKYRSISEARKAPRYSRYFGSGAKALGVAATVIGGMALLPDIANALEQVTEEEVSTGRFSQERIESYWNIAQYGPSTVMGLGAVGALALAPFTGGATLPLAASLGTSTIGYMMSVGLARTALSEDKPGTFTSTVAVPGAFYLGGRAIGAGIGAYKASKASRIAKATYSGSFYDPISHRTMNQVVSTAQAPEYGGFNPWKEAYRHQKGTSQYMDPFVWDVNKQGNWTRDFLERVSFPGFEYTQRIGTRQFGSVYGAGTGLPGGLDRTRSWDYHWSPKASHKIWNLDSSKGFSSHPFWQSRTWQITKAAYLYGPMASRMLSSGMMDPVRHGHRQWEAYTNPRGGNISEYMAYRVQELGKIGAPNILMKGLELRGQRFAEKGMPSWMAFLPSMQDLDPREIMQDPIMQFIVAPAALESWYEYALPYYGKEINERWRAGARPIQYSPVEAAMKIGISGLGASAMVAPFIAPSALWEFYGGKMAAKIPQAGKYGPAYMKFINTFGRHLLESGTYKNPLHFLRSDMALRPAGFTSSVSGLAGSVLAGALASGGVPPELANKLGYLGDIGMFAQQWGQIVKPRGGDDVLQSVEALTTLSSYSNVNALTYSALLSMSANKRIGDLSTRDLSKINRHLFDKSFNWQVGPFNFDLESNWGPIGLPYKAGATIKSLSSKLALWQISNRTIGEQLPPGVTVDLADLPSPEAVRRSDVYTALSYTGHSSFERSGAAGMAMSTQSYLPFMEDSSSVIQAASKRISMLTADNQYYIQKSGPYKYLYLKKGTMYDYLVPKGARPKGELADTLLAFGLAKSQDWIKASDVEEDEYRQHMERIGADNKLLMESPVFQAWTGSAIKEYQDLINVRESDVYELADGEIRLTSTSRKEARSSIVKQPIKKTKEERHSILVQKDREDGGSGRNNIPPDPIFVDALETGTGVNTPFSYAYITAAMADSIREWNWRSPRQGGAPFEGRYQ